MVLVVAIMATVAAIAVPRYAGAIARYHAKAAAGRIVVDLELARRFAGQASTARTVTFNTTSHAYTLSNIRSSDDGANNTIVDLTADPYRAQIVSADFGGDAVVIFNGYGVPDSGGTVVVQSGSVQYIVALDASTGKAAVQ